MGESAVAEALDDLFEGSANPTVAYLASSGEVKVRLTAKARHARRRPTPSSRRSPRRSRAGSGTSCSRPADESLEETVRRLLASPASTLAARESLTGGGVGARLTSVPGASA